MKGEMSSTTSSTDHSDDDRMNARDRLIKLLQEFSAQVLSVTQFCEAYERAYNLEINKSELTPAERATFQQLFDEVVYYSPYEDDRVNYPGYRDDGQIRHAAARAMELLES
jgi:hypothetical protein